MKTLYGVDFPAGPGNPNSHLSVLSSGVRSALPLTVRSNHLASRGFLLPAGFSKTLRFYSLTARKLPKGKPGEASLCLLTLKYLSNPFRPHLSTRGMVPPAPDPAKLILSELTLCAQRPLSF